MRTLLSIGFLCLLCAGATSARADNLKPSEINQSIRSETPYGAGAYTYLTMTVYEASLWTDATPWSINAPFALTLNYKMSLNGPDIAKRSVDEIEHITPLSQEESADYKLQLTNIFPSVQDGDEITALYIPQHGVRFTYNGKFIGKLSDPIFARRFLDIWLSEKTSAPRLRRKLLNLTDDQ